MPQVMKEEPNRLIDSGVISKYRGYTYFSGEKARWLIISCPKNISAVKKGESKKVQVAERLKDVISL